MRKFLLLLLAVVFTVPCFAHRHAYSFDKAIANVGTEANQTKNDYKYVWVIPAGAKKQTFANTGREESGLYNLAAKYAEYYYRWDRLSKKNTDLNYVDTFDNLDMDNLMIKVITGSNCENAGTAGKGTVIAGYQQVPHVNVKMIISSPQNNADGKPFQVIIDFGTTADDVSQLQELAPQSFDFSNTPEGKMFPEIQEIKVVFENVRRANDPNGNADWVCLQYLGLKTKSSWSYPILNVDKGGKSLNTGEIRIQAEDFDEPWINNRPAHSNTIPTNYAKGNSAVNGYSHYRDKTFDESCEHTYVHRLNDGGLNGLQHFSGWVLGHGTKTGDTQCGFVDFSQQEWNAGYTGELEPDGTATLDNLADFYGAWTEYTVDVDHELYADISLKTAIHNITYQAIRNGSPNCPDVSEEGVNYMAKYGSAYRVFVDDGPVQSAWMVRPCADLNGLLDMSQWYPNITDAPNKSRSGDTSYHFTYATPNLTHGYNFVDKAPVIEKDHAGNDVNTWGTTWSPIYRSDIAAKFQEAGIIDAEQAKALSTPDYANILLTPGKHTIRVQSMGGQTTFDEIKVQAHANNDTPTGVDLVQLTGGDSFDANAPVEWYNLQGMRVENPSNGIFIRRQGTRTTKVALK